MKKLIAILAIAGVFTACKNAKTEETKVDSPVVKTDSPAAKVDTAAVKVDTTKKDTTKKK